MTSEDCFICQCTRSNLTVEHLMSVAFLRGIATKARKEAAEAVLCSRHLNRGLRPGLYTEPKPIAVASASFDMVEGS